MSDHAVSHKEIQAVNIATAYSIKIFPNLQKRMLLFSGLTNDSSLATGSKV